MKYTVAALAVLLLVTTAAIGQQYQSPFPQAANPSLTTNTALETSPSADRRYDLPPSMAANQSSITTAPIVDRSYEDNVAAFPNAANPTLAFGTSSTASEMSPTADDSLRHDMVAPFPTAANPSR